MSDLNPVSELIACFGGIRPMQTALGEKYPNLIQNWQRAERIPPYREDQIRRAITERQIKVPKRLLGRLFPQKIAA